MQRRCLRMLLREVAEQDAGAAIAAGCQAPGDGLRLGRDADAGQRRVGIDTLQRTDCLEDLGQHGRQLRGRGNRARRQLDQQVVVRAVQDADLGAFLGRLAQALGQQRMVLAQEGADHQHAIEAADVGDLHAQPRRALTLAVGRKIAVAQAEIDVLAAQAAQQFLRQVHFFQRRVRTQQAADGRAAMRPGHVA